MTDFPRSLLPLLAAALLALGGCVRSTFETSHIEDVAGETIAVDLYLIGDAGEPWPGGDPVLQALTRALKQDTARAFVLFLGDNIYPAGLPDSANPYRPTAERKLKEQVDVLREARVRGIFIAGNHDWGDRRPSGLAAVQRMERFVEQHGGGYASFVPEAGCPGPEVLDFGEHLRLVILDTQWWLDDGPKPQGPRSPCPTKTQQEVVTRVSDALFLAGERVPLVIGHHPLLTGGEHGGYFSVRDYLLPAEPIARRLGATDQDVVHPEYLHLIRSLRTAFRLAPPLAYVSGHDHSLQLLSGEGVQWQIISGSGSYNHLSDVRVIPSTRYARKAAGYMRLTVLRDGRARLGIFVVDAAGEASEDYSIWLNPNPRQPRESVNDSTAS